jgi:Spy/CpxP family protein refolding chaperone
MTKAIWMNAALALMLASAPAMAQDRAGGPGGPGGPSGSGGEERGMRGMYAEMSEEGREIMRTAMRAGFEGRRDEREKIRVARDKMLAVVEAPTLDTVALKAAMDEEREISEASHVRRQEAMLAGLTQLSVEDRKAFVEGSRQARERVAERLEERREGRGGRRMQRRGRN